MTELPCSIKMSLSECCKYFTRPDADILAGKHPVKIELTEAVDDYEHDDNNTEDAESSDQKIDIMAQQFKFIACLKVSCNFNLDIYCLFQEGFLF